MHNRVVIYFTFACMLSACQTVPKVSLDPSNYIHDNYFPEYKAVHIEPAEEIFLIDDIVRQYLDENILTITSPSQRMTYLAEEIFASDSINIAYKNDATSIASDTFKNQEANCLSLTIMAYAMAEYSGFTVFSKI